MKLPLAALVAGTILAACASSSPPSGSDDGSPAASAVSASAGQGSPSSAEAVQVAPTKRLYELKIQTKTGREVGVEAEFVQTPRRLQRGLMYRRHLDPNEGMLFRMPSEKIHTFWMHNTLIPLDMIFIATDLSIVGVVANAEPLTDTPRSVSKPSRYVLEVNGGFAKAQGIGSGDRVVLGDLPLPVGHVSD